MCVLQASHEQHKKSIADLTEEAKRSQALVEEYVKQKETREEELYIKVTPHHQTMPDFYAPNCHAT